MMIVVHLLESHESDKIVKEVELASDVTLLTCWQRLTELDGAAIQVRGINECMLHIMEEVGTFHSAYAISTTTKGGSEKKVLQLVQANDKTKPQMTAEEMVCCQRTCMGLCLLCSPTQ